MLEIELEESKKTDKKALKREIYIKGARSNNLKNIDLRLPKNQLIVVTGVSGSGKSSLTIDTLYAEGPATICRISFFLCQAIPRKNEKT